MITIRSQKIMNLIGSPTGCNYYCDLPIIERQTSANFKVISKDFFVFAEPATLFQVSMIDFTDQ